MKEHPETASASTAVFMAVAAGAPRGRPPAPPPAGGVLVRVRARPAMAVRCAPSTGPLAARRSRRAPGATMPTSCAASFRGRELAESGHDLTNHVTEGTIQRLHIVVFRRHPDPDLLAMPHERSQIHAAV